jgi:PiT family inorganic phosphate transporter
MGTKLTKFNTISGSCASLGGAIIGVGAAHRTRGVKWGIAMNLLIAWVITIPASGLIAALFWWLGSKFL